MTLDLTKPVQTRDGRAHPHPFPIMDGPSGHALRDLEAAIDNMCEVDPRRSYGDSVRISAAAIQLTSIAKSIVRLHDARTMEAAE